MSAKNSTVIHLTISQTIYEQLLTVKLTTKEYQHQIPIFSTKTAGLPQDHFVFYEVALTFRASERFASSLSIFPAAVATSSLALLDSTVKCELCRRYIWDNRRRMSQRWWEPKVKKAQSPFRHVRQKRPSEMPVYYKSPPRYLNTHLA